MGDWERAWSVPSPRQWARLTNMVARGLKAYRDVYERARLEAGGEPDTDVNRLSEVDAAYATLGPPTAEVVAATEAPPVPLPEAALTFGEGLRIARVNAGLHQREVGELTGCDQSTVSCWERNEVTPVADHVRILIDLFPALVRWDGIGRKLAKPAGMPADAYQPPTVPRIVVEVDSRMTAQVERIQLAPPPAEPTIAELGATYAEALLERERAARAAYEANQRKATADTAAALALEALNQAIALALRAKS